MISPGASPASSRQWHGSGAALHHRRRGVACGSDGIANFELLRDWGNDARVFLRAFDLIELNGDDLRREPLICRKSTLAVVLATADDGIELNDHKEHDDAVLVFQHACKLGYEGIISKREDSPYRSGRSPDWIKLKNPKASAVKREAEEDWSRSASRRLW
jgi:ATP-dependent DNA ligase